MSIPPPKKWGDIKIFIEELHESINVVPSPCPAGGGGRQGEAWDNEGDGNSNDTAPWRGVFQLPSTFHFHHLLWCPHGSPGGEGADYLYFMLWEMRNVLKAPQPVTSVARKPCMDHVRAKSIVHGPLTTHKEQPWSFPGMFPSLCMRKGGMRGWNDELIWSHYCESCTYPTS